MNVCDFHFHLHSIECSQKREPISQLKEHIRITFLSDIGLRNGNFTKQFILCEAHKGLLEMKKRSRSKAKLCGVPEHLSRHIGSRPNRERNVTIEMMEKIQESTGVVIPIGTAICSNCRKRMTSSPSGAADENLSKMMLHVPYVMGSSDVVKNDIIEPKMEYSPAVQEDDRTTRVVDCQASGRYSKDYFVSTTAEVFDSSQDAYGSQSSQTTEISSISEASVCVEDKVEKLNSFLTMNAISPVKRPKVSLSHCSETTKNRYMNKALQCLTAVCDSICPGEGDHLEKLVCKGVVNMDSMPEIDQTTHILIEVYNTADTWTFRRQVLSILAEKYSFQEMKRIIPTMSKWRYYAARNHSNSDGCGAPVVPQKISRKKINDGQLEHFIDFITSSNVIKDLPYGMKTMKLVSGEIIEVPNLIRCLAPSSIVEQYSQYCEDEGLTHLGTSTMFKILHECAASVRKSLEGLDYYVSEGVRAFQDLEGVVEELNVSANCIKRMKTSLLEAKQYMKSDFKIHIQQESCVADHCRLFSLSDHDTSFSASCSHDHVEVCESCVTVYEVMEEIREKVSNASWENKDAIMFKVENAIESIVDWKRHTVRARNQETARFYLTSNLSSNQVLITCDWAMKFLPRKFRGGQTDWFAKRGINWHIAVAVYKAGDHLETVTHVHLFSSQIPQDGSVTASVICDVVEDLQENLPHLNEVHLFSDNAGCYKSATTLLLLKSQIGSKLKSYNFSEAHDGKGACDRKASHIKAVIKRYVNEGHDVTTADEMKTAIDAKKKANYRVRLVDIRTDIDAVKPTANQIPMISQYHNFTFDETGIRVWKAYGIGNGKLIPQNNLEYMTQKCSLVVIKDWPVFHHETLETQVVETPETDSTRTEQEEEPSAKRIKISKIQYDCPKEGCTRVFNSMSALENHLLLGNCNYLLERQPLLDRAKLTYNQKVNSMSTSKQCAIQNVTDTYQQSKLLKGWALKQKKSRNNFSNQQIKFMCDLFEIGKKTGRKVDPFKAAEDMRQIKNDESFVFSRNEYLTGQQISSFFSRMAARDKKKDMNDFVAAENEIKKEVLKASILDTVSQ